jgi:hypothetical protein
MRLTGTAWSVVGHFSDISALFRVVNRYVGNLAPCPACLMTAPPDGTLKLQRPLPDGALKIGARGVKEDVAGPAA